MSFRVYPNISNGTTLVFMRRPAVYKQTEMCSKESCPCSIYSLVRIQRF